MPVSHTLPPGYQAYGRMSLKDRHLRRWLNVLAVPWALLCGLVFGVLTVLLRPFPEALRRRPILLQTPVGAVGVLAAILLGVVLTWAVVLVLHELVHGLVFWLLTRARPTFGFKGWYAYAAAPGWYLSRAPFVVVVATSLPLVSVLGGVLLLLVPWAAVFWLLVGLIGNAVASIGDLYIIARLMLASQAALIEDQGEEITWYGPVHQVAA